MRTVTATPGQNVTVNFQLIPESTDDNGSGDGSDEDVEGPPGQPASIILSSVSQTQINIRGTGGIVNSILTFTVVDSAGKSLDLSNTVDVNFEIIQGPGGGEAVTPNVVTTNDVGQVKTSLLSGTLPGVVQVRASVTLENNSIISSSPILISINSGFPDPNKFFVGAENQKFGRLGYNPSTRR